MGAWGTGLFQDDTACDIREDYKDHLGNGLSGPEAVARILAEYKALSMIRTRQALSGSRWPLPSGNTDGLSLPPWQMRLTSSIPAQICCVGPPALPTLQRDEMCWKRCAFR